MFPEAGGYSTGDFKAVVASKSKDLLTEVTPEGKVLRDWHPSRRNKK